MFCGLHASAEAAGTRCPAPSTSPTPPPRGTIITSEGRLMLTSFRLLSVGISQSSVHLRLTPHPERHGCQVVRLGCLGMELGISYPLTISCLLSPPRPPRDVNLQSRAAQVRSPPGSRHNGLTRGRPSAPTRQLYFPSPKSYGPRLVLFWQFYETDSRPYSCTG